MTQQPFFYNNVSKIWEPLLGLPNKPCVYAFSTTNVTLTDNQVCTFQNAVVNIGNCYVPATSTFTAPIAGRYLVMAKILTMNNASAADCRIAINGVRQDAYSGYAINPAVLTTHKQGHVYGIVNLAKSDSIQIRTTGTIDFYGSASAGHTSLNISLL